MLRLDSGAFRARVACYIVCQVLVRLGYCINLSKSMFTPSQTQVYLGFIVDSANPCFRLTEEKRQNLHAFREALLGRDNTSVLELQKISGKCISFMLAIPGAKLYTREMNLAIAMGIKAKSKIYISEALRDELEAWRFLDTRQGKLEWKKREAFFSGDSIRLKQL